MLRIYKNQIPDFQYYRASFDALSPLAGNQGCDWGTFLGHHAECTC